MSSQEVLDRKEAVKASASRIERRLFKEGGDLQTIVGRFVVPVSTGILHIGMGDPASAPLLSGLDLDGPGLSSLDLGHVHGQHAVGECRLSFGAV